MKRHQEDLHKGCVQPARFLLLLAGGLLLLAFDRPVPLTQTYYRRVADLLRDPPAPGVSVDVDAYFSGATPTHHSGGRPAPDQVVCPGFQNAALTDRPLLPGLALLNGRHGNVLPDDVPWLIATVPEAKHPGVIVEPQLPYHARLRGHLHDPAFAHCERAGRIFVVEAVITVYARQPEVPAVNRVQAPPDYATWPRYHDAALGFGLPYPPDWTITPFDDQQAISSVALHGPEAPTRPVLVRVHTANSSTPRDMLSPPSPLPAGAGWSLLPQAAIFREANSVDQQLTGFALTRDLGPDERQETAVFNANGYTYELELRYPLGFDASQPLLTAYSAIVAGLRIKPLSPMLHRATEPR